MNWFDSLLVVWFGFQAIATVIMIGEPRKSLTSGQAAFGVFVNALLIWGVVVSSGW